MLKNNLIAAAVITLALAWPYAASAQTLTDGQVTKVDESGKQDYPQTRADEKV
jgi:hypothetical protein